jgi:hypothetical protein
MSRRNRERKEKRHSPADSIVTGLVFAAVFGIVFWKTGSWWCVFPMVFAGVLPVTKGIRELVNNRTSRPSVQELEADSEKKILQAAVRQNGRLTAMGAALETDLTLQEAQAALEKMAKNGHAVMTVSEKGLIEFEFPEFLPE